RRRHTRSKRDWSSDVCSSDLPLVPHSYGRKLIIVRLCLVHAVANCLSSACASFMWPQTVYHPLVPRSCGRKLFIIRLCPTHAAEIGRASCRERIMNVRYVEHA